MLIKLIFLTALLIPSIMATLSEEEMTGILIKTNGVGAFVQIFKKFEERQSKIELSHALANVAKVPAHIFNIVTCLRTVVDPFPNEMSNVSYLVHHTVSKISTSTRHDTRSFTKVITSFKPSDVKHLASIRYWTLQRSDAVKVMERVMAKSPKLIIGDLSRWFADHRFDKHSCDYDGSRAAREHTLQYLTLFVTENILTDALSIVKANEHYKVDSRIWCCDYQNSYPKDLATKLETLLILVKGRNELLKTFLSKVLVDIVIDYLLGSTDYLPQLRY